MNSAQDFLPRIFQADIDRLYRRVILPAIEELLPHEDVKIGQMNFKDPSWENAEKQTFNDLVYEVRRSFALTLGALFERQLRRWGRIHFPAADQNGVARMPFEEWWKKPLSCMSSRWLMAP